MRQNHPKDEYCPWCKAQPGDPCTVQGQAKAWFHHARGGWGPHVKPADSPSEGGSAEAT